MARQLILFRHGKSDWEAGCELDHQRPLAKRGIKAAKVMGKLLSAAGQVPDAVLTSSALRARSTVDLAAQAGSWTCPIRITDSLYAAEPKQVLCEIQQEPDTTQTLLLAGHEPTWSMLTALLIGGGQMRFPTAALARIDFEVNAWQQVAFGQGYLIWLLQPKLFLDRKI
jgi:phosphohistidine phosphatase